MKTRVLVALAFAALGVGCNNKKPEEGLEPPVPVGGTPTGIGNQGSATPGAPKPDAKLVERGDYLAKLLGCGTCHMAFGPTGPDVMRQFAGGLEIAERFGTWRSPNITPHKGSGIGNWKDEEIIAAVREGVRPDGTQLYPVMPYLNYNRMTDDDAKALVAYLRTIPAIDNVVAPNKDLKLPKPAAPKPANAPDVTTDPLKHGEYLVTLMHCNQCHTPVAANGMPDMAKQFAGGQVSELAMFGTGKLVAPNITADPTTGIGKWSQADIEKSIKTLTRPDGTSIQGPMQLYLMGWSQMKDADLTAIGAYLKQIPPIKNKVARSTFKPKTFGAPPAAGTGSAGAPPAAGSGAAAGSAAGTRPTTAGSGAATGSAAGARPTAAGSKAEATPAATGSTAAPPTGKAEAVTPATGSAAGGATAGSAGSAAGSATK